MENATSLKNEFILVKGDISGIQEFIFNVRSKKAANSIKGRSFFIKVLTEIAMQYFFDLFHVDTPLRKELRVSTSGGNFFILLPKLINNDDKIQKAQMLFSKSLRFSGLNIALNFIEFDENNYNECLVQLNSKVRKNKLKLYGIIDEVDFDNIFSAQSKTEFDKIDANEKWIYITNAIRNSNYFSIEKKGGIELKINNNSIELVGYTCLFHNQENGANENDISKYLESLFPLDRDYIIDFEGLTEQNTGIQKLGILKMDVDNLGTTLETITSINEHRKFDKELTDFFNDGIRKIIEDNYKFNNQIYPVTAGGDDSFFVGHWRTILDLAIEIQTVFSNYQYFKDKKLTISAGYIIINPKFPVVRFSQLADDALHKAKYKYDKGNICLFNEVVSWKILKEILKFKKTLNKGVNEKSKGLLAKSRQTAIKGIDENLISLKDNWEMSYFLRDCDNADLVDEIRISINKYLNESITSVNQMEKRANRLMLPIAARILELEKR